MGQASVGKEVADHRANSQEEMMREQQILHLFRTGLDTVDIVAWLKLHDGVRLTEAQVVRAMHRAIEAEREAAEAA
jgi:hypothetical protein